MSNIILEIQTNNDPIIRELRFSAGMKIDDLKSRLELITGSSAGTMELFFHDTDGVLIGQALDGEKTILDFHNPGTELRLQLKVKDNNPKAFNDDLSSVEKYEMSEDNYNERRDTVRSYKIANKIGRFSEDSLKQEAEEEEMIEKIKIGNRCEVRVENNPNRRGTVMYKGKLDNKPGFFVGVKFDEPLGKNNGSLEGKQYFECGPNYGGFLKPKNVFCGDFPEEEINFDD